MGYHLSTQAFFVSLAASLVAVGFGAAAFFPSGAGKDTYADSIVVWCTLFVTVIFILGGMLLTGIKRREQPYELPDVSLTDDEEELESGQQAATELRQQESASAGASQPAATGSSSGTTTSCHCHSTSAVHHMPFTSGLNAPSCCMWLQQSSYPSFTGLQQKHCNITCTWPLDMTNRWRQ